MGVRIADSAVRTLFLSDVHLGSRACHPSRVVEILHGLQPQQVYLVGDICDGWLLRRQWQWPSAYRDLVGALNELASSGSEVLYLLGNHDRCLHRWLEDWGDFWIGEQRIHHCVNGRQLLVIHGDQFDQTQGRFRMTADITARFHEQMLGGSYLANGILSRLGLPSSQLATALTVPFKSFAHSLSRFRRKATEYAHSQGCTGVICGHTHAPRLLDDKHFLYGNTGDWLEHCSVLVETESGQLELWSGNTDNWLEHSRRRIVLPAQSMTMESNT